MKRMFCAFLVFMMLLPIAASAEQKYYTIEELKDQVTDRWTGTYETKWRTITVDVQPTVPDVDKIPVMLLEVAYWFPELDQDVTWKAEPKLRSDGLNTGLFSLTNGKSVSSNNDKKYDIETEDYYPPFDSARQYAAGNDLTLGDVFAKIKEIQSQTGNMFFGIDTDHISRLNINNVYEKGTINPVFPGYYWMELRYTLHGVPLWGCAIESVRERKPQEVVLPLIHINFSMQGDHYYEMNGMILQEKEMYAEDVPLCSVDQVIVALESEITAGHLRAIFSLDLGFAIYNEPGDTRKTGHMVYDVDKNYYAVPAWQCRCIYVDLEKKQISEDNFTQPELSMYYQPLYVNAQTGKLLDPLDNHLGCASYQGFISWNDIQ